MGDSSGDVLEHIDQLNEDWVSSDPQGCIAPPPGLEEEGQRDTSWRHRIYGLPPNTPFSARASARSQNLAWRRWWEAHQTVSVRDPAQMFPATPTSTAPGTPRTSFCPQDSVFNFGLNFGLPAISSEEPMVGLNVPLRIAPEVQQCIDYLV